jgi:hypothetical protein
VVCQEGGKATVFKPDTTLQHVDDIVEAAHPQTDPRILVPPKMRN